MKALNALMSLYVAGRASTRKNNLRVGNNKSYGNTHLHWSCIFQADGSVASGTMEMGVAVLMRMVRATFMAKGKTNHSVGIGYAMDDAAIFKGAQGAIERNAVCRLQLLLDGAAIHCRSPLIEQGKYLLAKAGYPQVVLL